MQGIIAIWSGSVASIPPNWHLCDGTAGTPDLRDKFVIGAGNTYNPGDTATTNIVSGAGIAYYALAYIQNTG